MKKITYSLFLAFLATLSVCAAASYSKIATSNVALRHGVPGPIDFTQLFLTQADFDYYCSTGKINSGVSAEWAGVKPLPYAGQIVALAIDGSAPKVYVLKAKDDGMFESVEIGTASAINNLSTAITTAKTEAIDAAKGYVNEFAKRIYQIKGATNTVAQIEAFEDKVAGDVWYVRETKSLYVYTEAETWEALPTAIDLSKYSTTVEMETAISNSLVSAKKYTDQKISSIDLGAKRDKTDELVYSQTEEAWDFTELTKIDPTKLYNIRIEMEYDGDTDTTTYTYWLDRAMAEGGGSLLELEKLPEDKDVSNDNLKRLAVKSVVSPEVDAAFVKLVGTVIFKHAITTGDTLAHESLKADAESTTVYGIIDDGKIVIGEAKGLPIRNLSWYYNRENVRNIKILEKTSGEVEAIAENVSDWNGSEPSFVASFNYGGDIIKIKVSTNSISLYNGTTFDAPVALTCGTRVAKDAKRLNGKTYDDIVKDIDDKIKVKRDLEDEFVYSRSGSGWDLSIFSDVNPNYVYSIMPMFGDVDYPAKVVRSAASAGGAAAGGSSEDIAQVNKFNVDRYNSDPTNLYVAAIFDTIGDHASYQGLVGKAFGKALRKTGDKFAHEGLTADSKYAYIEESVGHTVRVGSNDKTAKIHISGSEGGVPIKNFDSDFCLGESYSKIQLYVDGANPTNAVNKSEYNSDEHSMVVTFNVPNGDTVNFKVTEEAVYSWDADNNVWTNESKFVVTKRLARDSESLGGKTAAEWATLVGDSSNNVLTAANAYTDQKTANIDMSSKRDLRDEYHYTLEWDFTEFNAIKDNVGYKIEKDADNEYIWKVYKVVPGEDDVAIANCSKVDPEEEEPTKLKIIVADLTDGDYAGLADKIISAYPSKTTDKFALKSDITKLDTSVVDVSDAKADAALYGTKSEVITVNGHDVVASIENGYAAKYIPLGFNGSGFDVKFYLTVDGSKTEIPLESSTYSAAADENDEYNTVTNVSFGGEYFPEELKNLGITSVKFEYVSGSEDYSSGRFKYTINENKESSTTFGVRNTAQAVDSRKFDGKSAMDWVNTFLPTYFYNKEAADTEFYNKYYIDSNVVTGQIDGVFFEARIADGSNVRVVLRGATLPITDILSWTNKTDCIELYASNNFAVAYSNPEVYQISTAGMSVGFNIRFAKFPNVGIHLEGSSAYIGNAIPPEYKFIGGVGKPYAPWHNPGLAPNSQKLNGFTSSDLLQSAKEYTDDRETAIVADYTAKLAKKVTKFVNYVYTPVGTNFILNVGDTKPNMKLYVYGVNSFPITESMQNLKTNPENIKLYVDGFDDPFTPTGFLEDASDESYVTAKFTINSTTVNIRIEKTRVGFWDPYVLHNWFFENLEGAAYSDQTAPNSHKFAGRTYEELQQDASDALEARLGFGGDTTKTSKSYTDDRVGLTGDNASYTAKTYAEAEDTKIYTKLGHFVNSNDVTIGAGATNVNHMEAVTLNGCKRYPSYTWGFANINIGLDNVVGFGDDGFGGVKQSDNTYKTNANYAVTIGTSSSAKYMHSYVFGSQAHSLAPNSFIFGYGATSTDQDTTILGFGTRPTADKTFATKAAMLEWFKSFPESTVTPATTAGRNAARANASKAVFTDFMISITNTDATTDDDETYYIKGIRSTYNATYGWFELYKTTSHDEQDEYLRGRHNWNYGNSCGKGTVNIIAKGDANVNYGPSYVYINGINLTDWFGIHVGEPDYITPFNMGKYGTPVLIDHNYTVSIGDNARCTETDKSCQSVALGRDALADGSAVMALGPNSYATGAQAISLGWRATAVGSHAISIGTALMSGQDYYTNGLVNSKFDSALALGTGAINIGFNGKVKGDYAIGIGDENKTTAPKAVSIGNKATATTEGAIAIGNTASVTAQGSIAIGNGASATANNSVQIGAGVVDTQNSFKFGDIYIIKNGEIVLGDPVVTDFTVTQYDDGEAEMVLKSNSNITLVPTRSLIDMDQLTIIPATDKRNYTITFPNEEYVRDGLPITYVFETPKDMKVVFKDNVNQFFRLPTIVKTTQPYDKLMVVEFDIYDDGTDWTPTVTRNNIVFADGKFTCLGKTALRGRNLHAATTFKIVYNTVDGVKTNDVLGTLGSRYNVEYSMTAMYNRTNIDNNETPVADLAPNGLGKTWINVIYETPNGKAVIDTKIISVLSNGDPAAEGLVRLAPEVTWNVTGGDILTNGYFLVKTVDSNGILVDPAEASLKYILQDNTTNTVSLSSLTSVEGGYRTADIVGLKLDTTNRFEYITIDSDVTNAIPMVVSSDVL